MSPGGKTMPGYADLARDYASGARELFATPQAGFIERGADPLVARAEALSPLSGNLTQAAAAGLEAADPAVRAEAEQRLLAKALADLEIAKRLFDAAQPPGGAAAPGLPERS